MLKWFNDKMPFDVDDWSKGPSTIIGTNLTIDPGEDTTSGFKMILRNSVCIGSQGRKLDREQKIIINMQCQQNYDTGNAIKDFKKKGNLIYS